MAGLLAAAVLPFSQRRCSQATCFHQDPVMFVTTEDLQLQLTGRTKPGAAGTVLHNPTVTTHTLMANTRHRWECVEPSRQLPLKNHSSNTLHSLGITDGPRGLEEPKSPGNLALC